MVGQLPSGGILLARMVGADEQRLLRTNCVRAVMSELECRAAPDNPPVLEDGKIHVESEAAKDDHNAYLFQQTELTLEKRTARTDLLGKRFVIRRSAAYRGGYVCAPQFQSVSNALAERLRSKAGGVERAIQKIARTIAREHTPRPVGSMGGGRQSYNQEPRFRIAKRRDWFTPIDPIAESAAFDGSDMLAVRHQPRTAAAGDNFGFEDCQV